MFTYKEKCEFDHEYSKIVNSVNDVYIELLKINPDDYCNDPKIAELINKVREMVDTNQADNSIEADDPETSLDDHYLIQEVIDEIKKVIEAYESLTSKLQDTADCILEKGYFTDLVAALMPYVNL